MRNKMPVGRGFGNFSAGNIDLVNVKAINYEPAREFLPTSAIPSPWAKHIYTNTIY